MAEQVTFNGFSDLNSPVGLDKKPATGKPEDSVIKMAKDLMKMAETDKKKNTEKWDKWRRLYQGEGTQFVNRDYPRDLRTLNVCRSTIQTKLPILTDQKPGFNAIPPEPNDFEFAEAINAAIDQVWSKRQMQNKMSEVLTDSMIVDAGIMKVTWNPDLEDGIGDIDVKVVNPDNIFPATGAIDFDDNCPYVIEKDFPTVGELKRKFPEMADQIKPDGQKDDQSKDQEFSGEISVQSPVDQAPTVVPTRRDVVKDQKTAERWELWIEDESLVEYELDEPNDEGKTKDFKKKYPNGRLVTILPQQNLLLQDIEEPYLDGDKPYVKFVDVVEPRQFWGQGEIEALEEQQEQISNVLTNMHKYMKMVGNPVWIADKEAGVNTDRITNAYGLIIKKNAAGDIKRDVPPPMPAYISDLLNTQLRFAEIVTGVSDVTQGRRPAGITAAQAIEELQEAAQTRIRLQERNLQTSLTRLGRLFISRILQFYTLPRMVKITGSEGQNPDFLRFFIERIEDSIIINTQKVPFNKMDMRYSQEPPLQSPPMKGIFDVEVLSGTSMPFSKARQANMAFRLFEAGAMDVEGLLDAVEWPDRDELMQRLQEQAARAAEQQQVAQAAQQQAAVPAQPGVQ